jgi:hypothetical protein
VSTEDPTLECLWLIPPDATQCRMPAARREHATLPLCDEHSDELQRMVGLGQAREEMIAVAFAWAEGRATDEELRTAVEKAREGEELRRALVGQARTMLPRYGPG